LVSGALQVLLVGGDAWRKGVLPRLRRPRLDADVRRFFRALGPATVGSAGVQLALFADTIIASFLATGALSALYYADRLNQLPIGVIGIAAGTVILPEMAQRLAQGDHAGAARAQTQAFEFTLLLALPCVVAFLLIPDLIMRALFARGAFTAADAAAAGQTLSAYAIGLVPFVLIRSATATFLARGDTATPVKAALGAVVINIALKIVLMGSLAQVGLALATSVGAWINLGLVILMAIRAGYFRLDPVFGHSLGKLAAVNLVLALVIWAANGPIGAWTGGFARFRDLSHLAVLGALGALVYGAMIAALFGRRWLAALRGRRP
jgi:putative peptidoglycan lipid II flippase